MDKIESTKKIYYDVLPAYNIDTALTYSSNQVFRVGSLVKISIRKKIFVGCILNIYQHKPKINFKIKEIEESHNYFYLDKKKIDFLKWVSEYNFISFGLALKLMISNVKFIEPNVVYIYIVRSNLDISLTNKQKVFIKEVKGASFEEQKNILSNYSKSFINNIIDKNIIEKKFYKEKKKIRLDLQKVKLKKLSLQQDAVYNKILEKINKKRYKPIFLDGVTGSGKTEVYFKIIKYYLLLKKQILILLPEIGLAHQWIDRFKKVFNFLPLNWNSSVSNNEKNKIWQTVSIGRPVVVVGTRSALFLPFTKLGLTIIDEENDMSYKQEDSLIYNARDMAIVRAKFTSSHLLLVSATPSLETYWNSLKKKYNYTRINKRYGISTLPKIELINMHKEKGKIFSTKTQSEIKKNLQEGKQTLILINRRGYAPITLCVKCGRTQKCLHCDINLVLHKKSQLLVCHHCGYSKNINSQCEFCKGKGNFIHVGIGIERVLEEAKKIFDTKSLIALSSDTFNSKTFSDTLKKIENNEIKILIATQIISKGFNFLHLNKVFILDFDMWFYNSDIRTSEKIFQLTQQVAGRAGRGNEPGKVYIQTYDIENSLLTKIKNNDRENFYKEELLFRERTLLPPFSKLVAIILQGKNFKDVESSSYKIKNRQSIVIYCVLFVLL